MIEIESLATTSASLGRLTAALQNDGNALHPGETAQTVLHNMRVAAQIGVAKVIAAVEYEEVIGLAMIRFNAEKQVGSIHMLYAVPNSSANVLTMLVNAAVESVWAQPVLQYLNATLFADQPGVREAFAAQGIRCVPREEMHLDDLTPYQQAEPLPDGFHFVAWTDDHIDEAARMTVEAYRGELDELIYPEMQTVSVMALAFREMLADQRDVFDPQASTLVYHGDTLAGVLVCAQTSEKRGYVIEINVGPDWRRKGLGRALMRHALSAFAAQSNQGAQLWVTLENPARHLYESLGFRSFVPMWVYAAKRP